MTARVSWLRREKSNAVTDAKPMYPLSATVKATPCVGESTQ